MADPRNTLVLLTALYPFGQKSETFLDDELPILARNFSRVIVLPSWRAPDSRKLPPGVTSNSSLADMPPGKDGFEILKRPLFALRQFVRALHDEGRPQAYVSHPKTYLRVIAQNLRKYRVLKSLITDNNLHDALFCDYWLENTTLALCWLRQEGFVKRAVARAHRFDLYDECWESGAVPFRAFKVAALDAIFAISDDGLRYLSQRHPHHRAKLFLSRLGVASAKPPICRLGHGNEGPPLVVSCSSMQAFKRVELIPSVLSRVGRPLSWVHFGDGPSRPHVERAARMLPSQVNWRLAGHVDHSQVIEYYRSNVVSLFISLSASEGLPVSMMEACSFGIPLLGTDVGGVREIVNPMTGALVRAGDSAEVVAGEALRILDGKGPSPDGVRRFFESHFDATRNFEDFARMLHAV